MVWETLTFLADMFDNNPVMFWFWFLAAMTPTLLFLFRHRFAYAAKNLLALWLNWFITAGVLGMFALVGLLIFGSPFVPAGFTISFMILNVLTYCLFGNALKLS